MFSRFCKTAKAALPLAAAVLLAGCSSSDETELRGWMNSVKQAARATSQPVPPHDELIPFVYDSHRAIEPFDPQKMVPRRDRYIGPLQPDLGRRRGPLEDFALERTIVCGLVDVQGGGRKSRWTELRCPTRITETELFLKEIVQDADGEWVERPVKFERPVKLMIMGNAQGAAD